MELPLMIQLLYLIMYGITESGGILTEGSSDRNTTEFVYWNYKNLIEEWSNVTKYLKKACLEVYTAQHRENLKEGPHLDGINEASKCDYAENIKNRGISLYEGTYHETTSHILECRCSSNPKVKSKKVIDSSITQALLNINRTFYIMKTGEEYIELEESAQYDLLNQPMFYLSKYWKNQ